MVSWPQVMRSLVLEIIENKIVIKLQLTKEIVRIKDFKKEESNR